MKRTSVAVAALLCVAGPAAARPNTWNEPARTEAPQAFMRVAGEAPPPLGWVDFCRRHPQECRETAQVPRDAVMTRARWVELADINREVNAAVAPFTDRELYQRDEYWTYPTGGRGDCEDYVLLKRRRLLDRGWPESALLITVVRDERGDGHAVLTVRTSAGDVVLDNVRDDILPWHQTGYRFVRRQSQWAPNLWVAVPDHAPADLSVARRR